MRMVLVGGVLGLAGCQSAADQHRAESHADDVACQSYGLKFGSPAYAQCRQQREAASYQQAAVALGVMQGMSRPQPAPTPYLMPTNRPVTTNCSTIGNQTSCTSQ